MSGGKTFAHVRFRTDRRKAFTLIELLVVISIVVLLMALLLPALSRARKQARAVVCQSRQRGWSLLFAAYQNDNEGRFPDRWYSVWDDQAEERIYEDLPWPGRMEVYSGSDLRDAMVCPSAVKPVPPDSYRVRGTCAAPGATFVAWRLTVHRLDIEVTPMPRLEYVGSYAMNRHLDSYHQYAIRNVKPAALPAFFDSRDCYGGLWHDDCGEPPPYEDFTLDVASYLQSEYLYSAVLAIDRHQGGINMLFGDGAIRKVGVKELWTLKWRKDFDMTGPWTKAGGVLPEDWPQWMRKFKDY
jgi:prepilin-type N-terminal cleavage/methylation domain-containing protein/prepilin-type processing-associated H-X9-DG protein